MRYDKKIYFVKNGADTYDQTTGNYTEADPVETMRMASVAASTLNTMRLVYGEIRQGSITVHLQNHYSDAFDRIRIGSKYYAVDYKRTLRVKEAYVCSEVQA